MDSWEKIERELLTGRGPVGDGTMREWGNRLRALRERDEKRWEMVGRAETVSRRMQETVQSADDELRWKGVADTLREAREGRDA